MDDEVLRCLDKQDWQALSDLLQRQAETWFEEGDIRDLQQLLEVLPGEYRHRHPWLDYWLGKCLIYTDLANAQPSLELAYEAFRKTDDLAGQCACCAAILDLLWLRWDDCTALDSWIEQSGHLRRQVQGEGHSELLDGMARSVFAGMSIRCPQHPDLPFWEELCLRQLTHPGFVSDVMQCGLQLMIHYTWGCGDRAKSTLVLETLKTKVGKSGQLDLTDCIYAVVHAAHLHWFGERAESCAEVVGGGLRLSRELGQPHWDIPMLNCIIYKCCALEQMDDIRHWLAVLKERIQVNPRPHDQAIHYHFLAYLAWLEGYRDEAIVSARQAWHIACASGFAYSPVYYSLALVAIETQRGEILNALRHLRQARYLARCYHSDNLCFMSLMQGAALAEGRGRYDAAIRYLRAALPIGARQRYFAIPWLRCAQLSRLCAMALSEDLETGYVQRLISALGLAPPAVQFSGADRWPWPCRIHVLGQIRVHVGDDDLILENKAATGLYRLLVHLVAAGPQGLDVERLMDWLWPDLNTTQAYQRLKTGLHRLRKLLRDSDSIIHANRRVCLNPERVWVDAWTLERCSETGLDADPAAIIAILNHYHGPPPASLCDDPALYYYPSRLEDCFSSLIIEMAQAFEARGAWDEALVLWRKGASMMEHHRFLPGMATCLDRLGRHAEAARIRKRYVEEYGEFPPGEQRSVPRE